MVRSPFELPETTHAMKIMTPIRTSKTCRTFSLVALLLVTVSDLLAGETLFPLDLERGRWSQFNVEGYETPVTGVIYLP